MVPKLRKQSQATRAKPNSLDRDTERARFETLHAEHEDPARLFNQLCDAAGLEKVQEHNNQLANVLRLSELSERKQGVVCVQWKIFTAGTNGFLDTLKKELQITDEEEDKTHILIQCAYFVRFPDRNASKLTERQMLAEIEGSTAPTGKKAGLAEEIQWSTDIVQQGFDAEYQKSDIIIVPTLNTLREYATLWARDTYKAPYTSIIGPTMSGKTRLLKELAAHVCVVYVCLRDAQSTGQPPRSEIAGHFLPPVEAKLDMIKQYCYLLAAILNTVSQFFSRPDIRQKIFKDQLAAWYDYSFQMKDDPKTEYNTNVQQEINELQANDLKPKETLAAAAKQMCKSLKFEGDGRLSVLLAIDEASNLINPIDSQLEIPYFRVLRRVLSEVPAATGFFGVFTDTTSRVANFNPALNLDPSARFHGIGFELFQPIYKVSSFDVFVPEKAPSSWDELLSPERLFSYGCPFYGLYLKGLMKMKPDTAVATTALIARSKLLLKRPLPSQELSKAQCFAILGALIQTRVSLHSPINSELVSSHAAHCMFIDETRDMVVSDYPPQFVYASAANNFLASSEARWIECIDNLAIAVQQGLVALGDAGEMATRLILLRAMQKTKAIPCDKTDMIPNGYSVRLEDFLQTLSGENPRTMKFGCIDDNNKKRLLDEGRVFFNHFTRISYTPSATDFLELLYRGVAIQCKSGQHGLDELFTIYLAPTSESKKPDPGNIQSPKLDPANITFCGVQTKNQAGSVDWDDTHKWSQSYAKIQGIKNPYLILLFSLRTTSINVKEWKPPKDSDDTGRVSYQFLGLDQIDCLTPDTHSALLRLITAVPDDLLNLHKKPHTKLDKPTDQWLKQLSPVFYCRAPEQPTAFPKPPKRELSTSPRRASKRT